MLLLHVEFPEAEVRDSGERAGGGAGGGPVRRAGPALALGNVNRTGDGGAEGSGSGPVNVLGNGVVSEGLLDPVPFEEEESVFPPPLLLLLLVLTGFVFGNGLLELEMNGVYGS